MNGTTRKRSLLAPCCWKGSRFVFPVRTADAGPLARAIRLFTTARTGQPYIPLLHLAPDQARICIYNSLLSEAAVLGFDYGYSLDYPNMLCACGKRSSAIS